MNGYHLPEQTDSRQPGAQSRSLGLQVGLLSLVLIAGIVLSGSLGYLNIPFGEVIRIVSAKWVGWPSADGLNDIHSAVLLDVRLPRILAAAIVGAGLAVSGVIFQGILLNPLADPYTLGVSAGAAFGAAVAILFGFDWMGRYAVPVFAFLGAAATLGFVIFLSASADGGFSSSNLVLSGIIVTAILSAGISFLKYLADEQVAVIIFWLMGSFASMTWPNVGMVLAAVLMGFLVFLFYARDLNLLSLGERTAASLGVDTRRVPLILLVTASLVTAVCVAVSGIIGFIGLLVPHMMRSISGPDNRKLIPVAMLTGAVLLLTADTITRAVLPHEIPIGVLTALIGGPFFCYIFRKRQNAGRGF